MATRNPWHTLETVRRELDRVFDDAGTRAAPAFRTAFLPGRAARQYPLTNLYEDKDAVYLEALAPGVDPATLELSVVGNPCVSVARNAGSPGRYNRKPSIAVSAPPGSLSGSSNCPWTLTSSTSMPTIKMDYSL